MKTRGLGRIYKRGRIWWIQYSFRGKVYRESAHSHKPAAATALLRRRQAEMGRGQLIGPNVERTTFDDLTRMFLDDYKMNGRKSLARAETAVDRLKEFFGLSRAVDITSDRIVAYIRTRQERIPRAAKPATIQKELAALKRMFTLAIRAGKVISRPHIPTLEVRNTRTGFFEESEFRAVLANLPEDLKALAELAYLTGWRIGEILPLSWSQVDFTASTIRLEPGSTKNDDGRVFPFRALPELTNLLEKQRERTRALEFTTDRIIPSVFHRNGKPIKDFRTAWKDACESAGVPGRLVHDLRRTAVRNLERAGVPRSVAMKLTGHRTESVYRRYAIVSETDLSEGIAKVAELYRVSRRRSLKVVRLRQSRKTQNR